MTKNKLLLILIVAVAGIAITRNVQNSGNTLTVVTPTFGKAVHAVYATGTVEPTVMLPLAPRISARLMALNADEGQKVQKGDILAQLEDTDVQNSIIDLTAKQKLAQQELKRTERLIAQRSIARAQADQAKATFDSATAALARAIEESNFLKILAPEDGRIIQRDGEVGELIQSGTPIFWVSCCAPLRISAEVDEEDIPLVEPGQKVLIRSDAFADQIFNGSVTSITPKGDPIARSYRVRIELKDTTPLRIGMSAETNIIVSEKENAMLVPSNAVIGNHLWFVDDKNILRTKNVKVGARGPKHTEITSGIDKNTLIVAEPSDVMVEGQKVSTRLQTTEDK